MTAAADKYLSRWACAEAGIGRELATVYDAAVVVPLYDEDAGFIDGVGRARGDRRLLVIAVVNAAEDAPAEAVAQNRRLLAEVAERGPATAIEAAHPATLVEAAPGFDVVVVDRNSDGHRFPVGEGVGLARRIGCDIALAAIASGRVRSPWIHTTDGDATLPADYLDAASPCAGAAALTYRYRHRVGGDPHVSRAYRYYELSLRYYVAGVRDAGSPYDYWSIGSTIAIDQGVYAAVRGFPRREAAEDFYLLNKARKHGPIAVPDSGPIELTPRPGIRVPFGTNAAVHRLAPSLARGGPFTLYDPRSFEWLGLFLVALGQCAATGSADPLARLRNSGAPILSRAIDDLGAVPAVADAATRCRGGAALTKRLESWFDAFRTLKLIHHMRAAGLPQVPWRQALADAPFIDTPASEAAGGTTTENASDTTVAAWAAAVERAEGGSA